MEKIKLNLTGLNEVQKTGILEISYDLGIALNNGGNEFILKNDGDGIKISWDGKVGHASYGSSHMIARCVGLIVENLKRGKTFEIIENPTYKALGFMLDCSRNAVITVEAFKKLTRKLALMGYSMIQLYTEDTYEMKEYPYFGYLRGRYTKEEFMEMDRYSNLFGIELVPCIQTLAHLETTLRWKEFDSIMDFDGILLADEEKTYEFIECMIKTMSECLTSRRINIGLDEAHMVGLGKHLDRHGYQNRITIMFRHLNRVMEIARKYGFRPMMWSDMFFRLINDGVYYAIDKPMDPEVIEKVPKDVDLVYWDYYNDDPALIKGMLEHHKQITDHVIFAGGAWKWSGLSPSSHFSNHIAKVAHTCCIKNGITEAFITSWGDNGALSSAFSVLSSLQLWAELCYKNCEDEENLKLRFETCVGDNYEDFVNLGLTMYTPDNLAPGKVAANPPTYILWQDILYGLFDKHIEHYSYRVHFNKCAEIFEEKINKGGKWSYLFKTQRALSLVLELKCAVGIKIHEAYMSSDKDMLHNLADQVLPELRLRIKSLYETERSQWLLENKAFGLDSFDLRIGGLLQRLEVAALRIIDYLDGKIDRIEELEEQQLLFDSAKMTESKITECNSWLKTVTPSLLV